jgi:hypothetical protein
MLKYAAVKRIRPFFNFIRKLYHVACKSKVFTIIPKIFDDTSKSVLEFQSHFFLTKHTHILTNITMVTLD